MKANCPRCGTVGRDEKLARGSIAVRFCHPCNLVFDGLRNPLLVVSQRMGELPRLERSKWVKWMDSARELLGLKRKDAA